jgi:hypothetical protein
MGTDLEPLGEAGRLSVEEKFSAAAMTDGFLDTYNAVTRDDDVDSASSWG